MRLKVHGGDTVDFSPNKVLLAGYTGRDEAAVRHHIDELKRQGIPAPETTPAFYPVLPSLLQTADEITTLDDATCGEAEAVFLFASEGVFVGLGSDHTDRKLEQHSVVHSKQLCPKPISADVWRLDDELKERWDQLEIRSWAIEGGERRPYQEGSLSALMAPERLFEVTEPHVDGELVSLALFGGTLPTLGGELVFAEEFEAELSDPAAGRKLSLRYTIRSLEWFRS